MSQQMTGHRIERVHSVAARAEIGDADLACNWVRPWIEHSVFRDAIVPKKIHDSLRIISACKHVGGSVDANAVAEIYTTEVRPVDERQEVSEHLLRFTHPERQRMRLAVRPSHPSSGTAGRQMGPLNVPEVFVI